MRRTLEEKVKEKELEVSRIFEYFGFHNVEVQFVSYLIDSRVEYLRDKETGEIKDVTMFLGHIRNEDIFELQGYIQNKFYEFPLFSMELFIILHEIGHLLDNKYEWINIPQYKLLLSTIKERRTWFPREKRADKFAIAFLRNQRKLAKSMDAWR